MSYDLAKMLRQRSGGGFHHLHEFRRRMPQTACLFVLGFLLFGFFFGPRLVTPGNEGRVSVWFPIRGGADSHGDGGGKDWTSRVVAKPPVVPEPPLSAKAHINCSGGNLCSAFPGQRGGVKWDPDSNPGCPAYFGFIYEDLKPWRTSGITLEMVETFKDRSSFRLTIVEGRMYIHQYSKAFQTRDVFTIWGFTQLMEYYPGLVPDLDLMFDCVDWPIIKADQYGDSKSPPPLFRYCADDSTLDIAFPDWSFWGWAEINIRPWQGLLDEIRKGTKKIEWEDRDPTAYWKGNPFVADVRQDLMKCNASQDKDWNARLYIQDWIKESQEGYKQSKLADQCDHRYKIYVEGSAWSVSLKNILACDSTTLILKPQYYDFFSRRLLPLEHYWPVALDHKCESIKVAVDWGNNNTGKSKAIGKAASKFMKNEVNMRNVYDYMFHLLREYSKLLRYKPSVPKGAKEVCTKSMYCTRRQRVERRFMLESMIRSPSQSGPCNLPSPDTFYEFLKDWEDRKAKALKQVEEMERKARQS